MPMRNGVEGREPSLAELLAPAGVVERYHDVGIVDLEIGRRIVEGEVRVLADADAGDVDLGRGQQGGVAAALLLRVGGVAVEQVDGAEGQAVEEPLAQVAPEAGRVPLGEPEVLVEVEGGDAPPVDPLGRQ